MPKNRAPRSASRSLKARLDELARDPARFERLDHDPVGMVHRFSNEHDRELVGALAALLAFGNVLTIRRKLEGLLTLLGPEPALRVRSLSEVALRRRIGPFRHRVWTEVHVARVLHRVARLQKDHGSVGTRAGELRERASSFREALSTLGDELRGPLETMPPSRRRGLRHLVPDPLRGSACKRFLLYARWMVRPSDGVDFGLWPLSPAELVMPVDTHILRISRNLGLSDRDDASWKTAEEITARLRTFDAEDPVKYDFALCHMGISRACPSRRDKEKCRSCVLRPVCRHHAPSNTGSR
ncbi:MAG: TIGR02757 family protein [Myxococcota bacterium]